MHNPAASPLTACRLPRWYSWRSDRSARCLAQQIETRAGRSERRDPSCREPVRGDSIANRRVTVSKVRGQLAFSPQMVGCRRLHRSRLVPVKHLRELDLPVEGHQRRLGVPRSSSVLAVLFGAATAAPSCAYSSRLSSRSLAFALEECGDDQIAEQPHVLKFLLRLVPEGPQLAIRTSVPGFADLLPQLADLLECSRICIASNPFWISGADSSQWNASICSRDSPTSESPCRRAWSTKVSACSFASVTSQSDTFARSTATGFRSTP